MAEVPASYDCFLILFLPLASKLFKNSITLDTVVYKNVPLLFFA